MIRLLVFGAVFTLWSLAAAAPVNDTATTQPKGIVFPKKAKLNETEKIKDQKTTTTTAAVNITSTEASSTTSPVDLTTTVDEKIEKSGSVFSTEQVDTPVDPAIQDPVDPTMQEEQESLPEETSPDMAEGSEVPLPLPPDANDGLIEYNLGNPLALKLHLPWWPLKDMLRSIQDAISVMNLTVGKETLEPDGMKTKIVRFDDRNYTLKVRVFKPAENNRLLVRLISLTPIIDEGKLIAEKGEKVEDEQKNEALDESATVFSQMKKKDDEESNEQKPDDSGKEEKNKSKDSKKEKQNKKKTEQKRGDDSEEDSN